MDNDSNTTEKRSETSSPEAIQDISPDDRFKLLFDTMKQGIVHQATDGQIIHTNKAAEEILGVDFDQMMDRTSKDPEWAAVNEDGMILPGKEHPSMVALRTGEKVLDFIMGVNNPKKGQRIWIKIDAIPLFKEGEIHPYEVYTVFEDITDNKIMEGELRDGEERYRGLFEAAGDAIMITRITQNGPKFEACNKKAAELFRVEPGKLCGMDPMEISPPFQPNGEDSGSTIMANIQKVMMGETVQIEWVHRRIDGTDFPCEVTLSSIQTQQGPLVQAIVRDISERKSTEDVIRRSEEKYRHLIETTPEGISTTDLSGNLTSVNPANLEMLGYDNEEELLGKPSIDLIKEEQREKATEGMLQTFEKGKIGPMRYDLIRKDGTFLPAELIASLIRDKKGEPESFIAVTRDISDRVEAEKELQDSESRYRLLFENAKETILVAQDGMIRFVNPMGPELLGFSMEELKRKQFLEFVHPEDRIMVGERHQKRLRGDTDIPRYPFRLVDINDNTKWVEVEAVQIPWDGRPATLNFLSDVTDRMKFEEALKESEEKYRSLIDNISDAVFEVGMDFTFNYTSPQVKDIFGYEPEEIIGKSFIDFIHPDDIQRGIELFSNMTLEKRVTNFEFRSSHKDGHYLHINSSGRLVEKKDGTRSVVVVLRDVTEKILSRNQIESEKNRAEFYLDLLSHDIGNIHQGLQSWTEIAKSPSTDEKMRNMALSKIEELEHRSLRLVRNVLMLSRLKDLKENFDAIDIVPLITNAIDDIKTMFGGRTMEISFSEPSGPIFVSSESVVEEVFFNLLHNGVKFQDEDPVKIDVSLEVSDEFAIMDIADHGIGIPNDQKTYLFDRHIKGSDQSYSGIGLSLVKELVQRYNGTIEVKDRVEGDPKQGARFRTHLLLAEQ